MVLTEASLGLSASRARWLEGWYSRLLRDRSVQMQEFQEGLGRAAFVWGALDYDRPILVPLYAFAARHAPGSVEPLPLYVLVTVEYLRAQDSPATTLRMRQGAHQLERGVEGRRARRRKRSGSRWWPRAIEKGQVDTRISPWFAIKVTPETAPWAFQREGSSASGVQRGKDGSAVDAEGPEPGGGRFIKPPNGPIRSRERGEGGLRGSELVRSASAARKRSELPRGEAKRSTAAGTGGRRRKRCWSSGRSGRRPKREKARRRKGPREHAVLQSLAVVNAQGAIFAEWQFSRLSRPPIFRSRFLCLLAVTETVKLSITTWCRFSRLHGSGLS